MGCLAAPFRLLGWLVLLAALAAGWLYREQIIGEARRLYRQMVPPADTAPARGGRPGARALASAHAKIDSLNGWRADSVVLTRAELASMVGEGLDPDLRARLDSLEVHPREDDLTVSARLATADLSRDLLGPFAGALRPTEPVVASGPVRVAGPRRAEWAVRSFRIGDVAIPKELVPTLVGRILGDPARRAVPVRIPEGIRAIRLTSTGAILYGASSR